MSTLKSAYCSEDKNPRKVYPSESNGGFKKEAIDGEGDLRESNKGEPN